MTDWIKVLVQTDDVPEGWSTVNEVSEQLNIPPDAAYKRLLRRLAHNEVERKKVRINGVLVSIWKPKDAK
jgi:predicted transcriptional regulator